MSTIDKPLTTSQYKRIGWLELMIPLVIGALAVYFRSFYLLDPRWAWVGDEGEFRSFATMLMTDRLLHNPLAAGVYEGNSILSSQFQAIFLLLPGNPEFLWRLSSLIVIIPASLFCYLWMRQMFDLFVAVSASIFLSCSFFLWNFLPIGYPNGQILVAMYGCFWLLTLQINRKQPSVLISGAIGIWLGIAWYIYHGQILALICLPYFFFLHKKNTSIKSWKHYSYILVPFLLLIIIGLIDIRFITNVISRATSQHSHLTLIDRFWNVLRAATALFYNPHTSHFIYGSYLDVITSGFAAVGLGWLALTISSSYSRILLLSLLIMIFIVGMTSIYPLISPTRGLLVFAFGPPLAAIGFSKLISNLSLKIQVLLGALILPLLIASNFDRSNAYFTAVGIPVESCLLVHLVEAKETNPTTPALTIISENPVKLPGALESLQSIYKLSEIPITFDIATETHAVESNSPTGHVIDYKRINQEHCKSTLTDVTILPWTPISLWPIS